MSSVQLCWTIVMEMNLFCFVLFFSLCYFRSFLYFSWWNRLGASGKMTLCFSWPAGEQRAWVSLLPVVPDPCRSLSRNWLCQEYFAKGLPRLPRGLQRARALSSCGLGLSGCQHLSVFIDAPLPSALNFASFRNRPDNGKVRSSTFRGFV